MSTSYQYRELKTISHRFWNATQSLYFFRCVDVRTHMNIIQLNSGKFLVIDTIGLTPGLKAEIDHLTNNGRLIEAVIATHPFHTLYFPAFYAAYPHAAYYGTPRHIRNQPQIPWAGDVSTEAVQGKWSPEVEMAVPDGAEFIHPEEGNHFSSLFVFHRASRTIHVDDTIMVYENIGCMMGCLVRRGSMGFHLSITSNGMHPTASAGFAFKNWLQTRVLDAWDFDNICSAHMGNMIGGAKARLQETLNAAEPVFQKHSRKHAGR